MLDLAVTSLLNICLFPFELFADCPRSLQDTDSKYYDFANSVMQRSFFLALKYGGQAMSNTSQEKKHPGGSIVVTSSMAGVAGAVSDLSYCKISFHSSLKAVLTQETKQLQRRQSRR
jgi:hypothetical protein